MTTNASYVAPGAHSGICKDCRRQDKDVKVFVTYPDVPDTRTPEKRKKESDGKKFWNPGGGVAGRQVMPNGAERKLTRAYGNYAPKELLGYLRMVRGFNAPTPAERDRLFALGRSFILSHDTTGWRWLDLHHQLTQAVGAALTADHTQQLVAELWSTKKVNEGMQADAKMAQGDLGKRQRYVKVFGYRIPFGTKHPHMPATPKP
jgi:hypothetical protein